MMRVDHHQSEKKKSKLKLMMKSSNIPTDEVVIDEIFPRLPARSVIRLSSACKSWRSPTVRDLPFLNAHRAARWFQSPRPSSFILKNFQYAQMTRIAVASNNQDIAIQEEDMDMDMIDHHHHSNQVQKASPGSLGVVASCDNLLCLVSNRLERYYVHNLSTKEWMVVPTVCRGGFLSSFLRAFYYHPSTGEYRLLTWFKTQLPPPSDDDVAVADPDLLQRSPIFGVFSLKLGTKWRLIDGSGFLLGGDACQPLSRLTQGYGMFRPRTIARGNVHWAPMYNYPWILAFDIETEKFRQLDIPRRLRQHQSGVLDYVGYHLVTLGQDLVLGITRDALELELWLLKDYKYEEEECWVKLHTISIPTIINAMSSSGNDIERDYEKGVFFQPVGLCSGPAYDEDLLLLRYNSQVFILYNLISKSIKWVTAKAFCGLFVASLTETLPCLLYSFNQL